MEIGRSNSGRRTDRVFIAMSGGGFRASLFGAGVLRALHHHGWLDYPARSHRPVFINAVSGGTIPTFLWSRYSWSDQYQDDPADPVPERALLDLVTGVPRGGRWNWAIAGLFGGRRQAWTKALTEWWDAIPMTRERHGKLGGKPFPWVQFRPHYCAATAQVLDHGSGTIFAIHEGRVFETDTKFFERGSVHAAIAEITVPEAIAMATAFPLMFKRVTLPNGAELMDAGVIDNQAIFNWHPLMRPGAGGRLGPGDTVFLVNVSRAMRNPGTMGPDGPEMDLTPMERIFRYTGDLAQPKTYDILFDLLATDDGPEIFGIRVDVTAMEEKLWVSTPRLNAPSRIARVETSLGRFARDDAVAIMAFGAQAAALALGMPQAAQDELRGLIRSLL